MKAEGQEVGLEYMVDRVFRAYQSGDYWIIMVAPEQIETGRAIQRLYPEERPVDVYEVFEVAPGWYLVLAAKSAAGAGAVAEAIRSSGAEGRPGVEVTAETVAQRDTIFAVRPDQYRHAYGAVNSYINTGRARMMVRTAPWN